MTVEKQSFPVRIPFTSANVDTGPVAAQVYGVPLVPAKKVDGVKPTAAAFVALIE